MAPPYLSFDEWFPVQSIRLVGGWGPGWCRETRGCLLWVLSLWKTYRLRLLTYSNR